MSDSRDVWIVARRSLRLSRDRWTNAEDAAACVDTCAGVSERKGRRRKGAYEVDGGCTGSSDLFAYF